MEHAIAIFLRDEELLHSTFLVSAQIRSAVQPDLPVTIELPLTLVRPVGGSPSRRPKSLKLEEISAAIRESLACVTGR